MSKEQVTGLVVILLLLLNWAFDIMELPILRSLNRRKDNE